MCDNMILEISMIGVVAFTLAEKIGLDIEKLYEVSSNSSGSCWALNTYPKIFELDLKHQLIIIMSQVSHLI